MWSVLLSSCSSQFIHMQIWDQPTPLAATLPALVLQLPPCSESSLPCLPISWSGCPSPGLDGCFFFISLVVRLPYSLIFCQFWLFMFLNLLLSFFWLCEEAQYVYQCLHLGQKLGLIFKSSVDSEFIYVCGLRKGYSFIFLHISVQLSQHHSLNKVSLVHCM